MVAKDYQRSKGSTKAEVGEIDTSAPFQSVKDAVSLFGEGAFSGSGGKKHVIRKAKPQSAERVLAKEMQLHLAQKELHSMRDHLKNDESTKSQALVKLEKAKRTVDDLTRKLKIINDSKNSAIKAAEFSKHRSKQLIKAYDDDSEATFEFSNIDLESVRIQYKASVSELDVAKEGLRIIRQEYDAYNKAKETAINQTNEVENATEANIEKVSEIAKEISRVQNSIQEAQLAIAQMKEEETEICDEKEKQNQSYKCRIEEAETKVLVLKKNTDSYLRKDLETQLAETLSEIDVLRNKIDSSRATDFDHVKNVTSELDGAKESLHKVVEEKRSLTSMVETLKLDLDKIKRETSALKEKEAQTESVAGSFYVKIQEAKSELDEALSEKAKTRGASDRTLASICHLASESENAKLETGKGKQETEEFKREAAAAKIRLEEAEKKLVVAIKESEETKADETRALGRIKLLSEKTDGAHTSTSETGSRVTLSREEYESLRRKVGESEKIAEIKVAAALAQVEASKGRKNEANKRFESIQKEIQEIEAATSKLSKKAEMDESAKKAVEGELRKWRIREKKKAAEIASRILAEAEEPYGSSPRNYHIQTQRYPNKAMEGRMLEKAKTSVAKKVLMPSMTSVFHKKKNKVEGGSPSYLPGEKPVW